MNGLYPIIRRIRRPLLPPDDPAPVVPVVVAKDPPPAETPRVTEVAGEAATSAVNDPPGDY